MRVATGEGGYCLFTDVDTTSPHPHCNARFPRVPAKTDGAVILPEHTYNMGVLKPDRSPGCRYYAELRPTIIAKTRSQV
ncbi:hypothetical protein C6H65_21515 [Photorhabdus luminescens]|nr:hypothetical protein C6H65_21515 [Photorhabdus luminescens]